MVELTGVSAPRKQRTRIKPQVKRQAPEQPETPIAVEAVVTEQRTPPRDGLTMHPPQHPPLHEPVHQPELRTRRRRAKINDDIFALPMDEIPSDLSYEWKRFTVHGQEDPFYIAGLRRQGWEPVPPSRHPNWLPDGYNEPHIIRGGQILMDRPRELTLEARAEERQAAKQQVIEAEQRLGMTPRGEATRSLPEIAPRVQKEMMRPVRVQGEE